MRILANEAMRGVDRTAIEELGVPGAVLMENAALGVVEVLDREFPEAGRVVVLCGPGNNGGDGLAVARHLLVRGVDATAVVITGGRKCSGEAAMQRRILGGMQGPMIEIGAGEAIEAAVTAAAGADAVVDALFGTGLSRPLDGQFADLVEAVAGLRAPSVAVDLASGLNGDSSARFGPHLPARATVALGALKPAHVFFPAAGAAGRVYVSDLGIPESLIESAPGDLHWLDEASVAGALPARPATAHKGDCGHVLLVAGSPGKTGAAILAARAAVRAGAGLVTVATPASCRDAVDLASIESMTLALPEAGGGGLGEAAAARILESAEGKSAVALGPGLGLEGETATVVREVVGSLDGVVVVDADAINAFAGRADELAGSPAPRILTPHSGELARLMECSTAEVGAERVTWARRAAEATGALVLLKGRPSVIAEAGGGVFVNSTGNPGLASGGTGDVLTGTVAALPGQGLVPLRAAQVATFAHGLAGDLAAGVLGEIGLNASDVVAALPEALGSLSRASSG